MLGRLPHLIVIMLQLMIRKDYIRIGKIGLSIRDGWKPMIEVNNNV
jgi:hypothetical protein